MPMIPSVMAAATYTGLKLAGYYGFAHLINQHFKIVGKPFRFAIVKIIAGLVGGFVFVYLISSIKNNLTDASAYALTLPLRLIIWGIVLRIFYQAKLTKRTYIACAFLGLVLSVVLDCVMYGLYRVLPGMQMPFC